MMFLPFVSIVSLFVIGIAVIGGYGLQALIVMLVFMLIQLTYSFLAVQMDNEDLKLTIYAPFFVIGYKELRNFIKIKSLFDVILKRQSKWGSLQRVGTPKRSKK